MLCLLGQLGPLKVKLLNCCAGACVMGGGFGDGSWTCCEVGGVGLFLGFATVGLGLLGAPCCCLFC